MEKPIAETIIVKPLENILLLSCRSPYLDSDKVYPPLGNLYLHTAIQKYRPDTKVTVTDNYSLENTDWLKDIDGIGVSIMTPQRAEAHRILEFVKRERPDISMFAGGPHCHYYAQDIKDEPWDYICQRDGERVILDIIDQKGPKIKTDFMLPPVFKLNAVKPNRLDNAAFLKGFNYKLQGRNSTTMLTAQGCPEQCTFCEDAMSAVRWTPFDLIKEELDDIQTLGYKGVYIFDDIFAIAYKQIAPIAEELSKRGILYRCNGQARRFNEEFAQMLSSTGCVEIAFGAETGSQVILDNIRKRTTVQANYQFVELCNKYDIQCKAFLMLGLPGENYDTIRATEDFIKNSGIKDFQLAIYYPYKGTQIRDAIDKGETSTDLFFHGEGLGAYGQKGGSTEAVVATKALSAKDLLYERDRLINTYKPNSHRQAWENAEDQFFNHHIGERVE